MTKRKPLTTERLKELLEYDPRKGVFYWRVDRGSVRAGTMAGCSNTAGYIQIVVDGRNYTAHRLAWLYMADNWPTVDIDHRDRNKANNKWCNLRLATRSQNNGNTRVRNNSTGFKGVYRKRSKFTAEITVNYQKLRLGTYDTPEAAHIAYATAAQKHFGEFARTQ